MKIPNKRELRELALNHSSDIDLQDFMNLIFFLVNDTISLSNNPLPFRKNLVEWIHNKIMTNDDHTKDEKRQYDINREAAKTSVLSPGKINDYEYLTGKDMLPSTQKQIIEKAKFTYSPLGNPFEKQTKMVEDQIKKWVDAINL